MMLRVRFLVGWFTSSSTTSILLGEFALRTSARRALLSEHRTSIREEREEIRSGDEKQQETEQEDGDQHDSDPRASAHLHVADHSSSSSTSTHHKQSKSGLRVRHSKNAGQHAHPHGSKHGDRTDAESGSEDESGHQEEKGENKTSGQRLGECWTIFAFTMGGAGVWCLGLGAYLLFCYARVDARIDAGAGERQKKENGPAEVTSSTSAASKPPAEKAKSGSPKKAKKDKIKKAKAPPQPKEGPEEPASPESSRGVTDGAAAPDASAVGQAGTSPSAIVQGAAAGTGTVEHEPRIGRDADRGRMTKQDSTQAQSFEPGSFTRSEMEEQEKNSYEASQMNSEASAFFRSGSVKVASTPSSRHRDHQSSHVNGIQIPMKDEEKMKASASTKLVPPAAPDEAATTKTAVLNGNAFKSENSSSEAGAEKRKPAVESSQGGVGVKGLGVGAAGTSTDRTNTGGGRDQDTKNMTTSTGTGSVGRKKSDHSAAFGGGATASTGPSGSTASEVVSSLISSYPGTGTVNSASSAAGLGQPDAGYTSKLGSSVAVVLSDGVTPVASSPKSRKESLNSSAQLPPTVAPRGAEASRTGTNTNSNHEIENRVSSTPLAKPSAFGGTSASGQVRPSVAQIAVRAAAAKSHDTAASQEKDPSERSMKDRAMLLMASDLFGMRTRSMNSDANSSSASSAENKVGNKAKRPASSEKNKTGKKLGADSFAMVGGSAKPAEPQTASHQKANTSSQSKKGGNKADASASQRLLKQGTFPPSALGEDERAIQDRAKALEGELATPRVSADKQKAFMLAQKYGQRHSPPPSPPTSPRNSP